MVLNRLLLPLWLALPLLSNAQVTPLVATPVPAVDTVNIAQPLSARGKFHYRFSHAFGKWGFVQAAAVAGFNQVKLEPREWGGGMEGYSKRYASAFGEHISLQGTDFLLEAALHEDPRYFPSTSTSGRARFRYAVLHALIARKDSGGETFAFARVGSAFAAGEIANTWQPPSTGRPLDVVSRAGFTLLEEAAINVLKEFYPRFRDRD
jgi:hypothetical protein